MTIKYLKPGMEVFIREDLKAGGVYGDQTFVKNMERLTGLQKITEIGDTAIKVNNERWYFTSEMIDWDKTKRLNNKNSGLFYDGTTLEGRIDGQEIKVVRSSEDKEDLEKAVMMGLLKSLGYSFEDVKKLQNKVKKVWKPKYTEIYYYVGPYGEVESTRNLNHDSDKKLFEVCNYFKTKEEAEQKATEFRELLKKIGGLNEDKKDKKF